MIVTYADNGNDGEDINDDDRICFEFFVCGGEILFDCLLYILMIAMIMKMMLLVYTRTRDTEIWRERKSRLRKGGKNGKIRLYYHHYHYFHYSSLLSPAYSYFQPSFSLSFGS